MLSFETMADTEIATGEKPPVYHVENSRSISKDIEKTDELTPNQSIENGVPSIVFKHADLNDADEAMKALAGHEGEYLTMTPEEGKKLLRKIDWNLMPASFLPHRMVNF